MTGILRSRGQYWTSPCFPKTGFHSRTSMKSKAIGVATRTVQHILNHPIISANVLLCAAKFSPHLLYSLPFLLTNRFKPFHFAEREGERKHTSGQLIQLQQLSPAGISGYGSFFSLTQKPQRFFHLVCNYTIYYFTSD